MGCINTGNRRVSIGTALTRTGMEPERNGTGYSNFGTPCVKVESIVKEPELLVLIMEMQLKEHELRVKELEMG